MNRQEMGMDSPPVLSSIALVIAKSGMRSTESYESWQDALVEYLLFKR